MIHIRELDKNSGVEVLGTYLIQKSLLNDQHAVVTLLEQLTFLLLAVTQAAAYINGNSIRIADYLLLLQEQEAGSPAGALEFALDEYGKLRMNQEPLTARDLENEVTMILEKWLDDVTLPDGQVDTSRWGGLG